jgi:predicted amidohydrolase
VDCLAGQAEDQGLSAKQTVRVAAISFVPVKFDLRGNADRLERAFREASKGQAQIAVAPEGALEGYVVNEIIRGDVPAERMREVALAIDDAVIRRFQQLARELELSLVFGFAEKIGDDVFNCAVFIDQTGQICGKYHKMQLAEGSHPTWWFNRLGARVRAFDTPYGRCGMLICNDRWNPQLARLAALDGAQFLVIPSFGSRGTSQDEAVLSRGRENGVPIVEANVGVSLIVDDGRIAAVDRREEGITFATITIPAAREPQPEERDRLEREFLQWRETEMPVRYQKTIARQKPARDEP